MRDSISSKHSGANVLWNGAQEAIFFSDQIFFSSARAPPRAFERRCASTIASTGKSSSPPLLAAVHGTDEFQRLDQIRQLGACSYVYPSATHTRREHSIGVAHLAGEAGEKLRALYPDLVMDADVLLLQLAGLLHDVGHGPFSHLFEEFMREEGREWDHEEVGIRLARRILAREEVAPLLPDGEESLSFLEHLIRGLGEDDPVPPETGRGEDHRFLFQIIHCRSHGIDVDRLDYLERDSLAVFGTTRAISSSRILSAMRVRRGRIAFQDNVVFEISEVLFLRAKLHRKLYQHRKVLLTERVLKKVLRSALASAPEMEADSLLLLTDASVLASASREARAELHSRSERRAPITVSLNLYPRCSSCRAPVPDLLSVACPQCGSRGARVGERLRDGTLRAREEGFTGKSLGDDVEGTCCIATIRTGELEVRPDAHGQRWWVESDPLSGLVFLTAGGEVASVPHRASVPRRERIVYCYDTPHTDRLLRWT